MVNRVADKESAKSILKHNGNQAAMIGMEILYTIISTLTVTSMMAAFSAAAVRIYGTIKTDEPRTLDFSGVRGFLVTNVCIVQRSAV